MIKFFATIFCAPNTQSIIWAVRIRKKKNSHNSKFLDNIVLVKTCNLTIMKTDCLAIKISKDYLAKENA